MSRSHQEQIQRRQTRAKRTYTGEGRPFRLSELNPGAACSTYDSAKIQDLSMTNGSVQFFSPVHCSGRAFNPLLDNTRARTQNTQFYSPDRSSGVPTTSEDSYFLLKSPVESSGRPINPVHGNRLASAQQHCRRQLSQKESRYKLECEMAKNREIALQRLREEQQMPACSARPQAQCQAYDVKKTRQHLMTKAEGQQGQKAYSYNIPAGSTVAAAARPMEMGHEFTKRGLNLLTTKQQRARSCSTPVRSETAHCDSQRQPKMYARLAKSTHGSPLRSVSPTQSRYSETAQPQNAARSVKLYADKLAQPVYSPDTSAASTNVTSSEKAHHSSPHRAQKPALVPQEDATPRQNSQHNSNVCENRSPHLNAALAQTPAPAISQIQYVSKTPSKPANNSQNPITSTTLHQTDLLKDPSSSRADQSQGETSIERDTVFSVGNETMTNEMHVLATAAASLDFDPNSEAFREIQRICQSIEQSKLTPRHQTSPQQLVYYHQQSYDRRIPNDNPTDKTEYVVDDMDISNEPVSPHPPHAIRAGDSSNLHSWQIPQEDLTCHDCSFNNQQPTLFSSTMKSSERINSHPYDILHKELDSTEYLELPSNFQAPSYHPAQICAPCEQPKASLFRCLAQKLSTTFNFLASLVAAQKSVESVQTMTQTTPKRCNPATFDAAAGNNASLFRDTTNGLRELYAIGGKKMEELPASVKECASAKRCGRIQFDNSDKQEMKDPNRSALRKAEIENLVNDTFCPGLIQATIDGTEHFNKQSFNMAFGASSADVVCSHYSATTSEPITLLEAFSMRIDKTRAGIMKDLREDFTEEQIAESIEKHFANQNPTDLNRSIKSYLLAERLKDNARIEETKGPLFEAEVHKWAAAWPDSRDLKITSYTGRTIPVKPEAETVQKRTD